MPARRGSLNPASGLTTARPETGRAGGARSTSDRRRMENHDVRVLIVYGSVREGRLGAPLAEWLVDQFRASELDVDYADLKEVALPFMDEPNHPVLRRYTKPHTIAWSERVDAAEAFVFISPEYNHSLSPALKNAIDFLQAEWDGKLVALASYGGISGGSRATAALAPTMTTVGLRQAKTSFEVPFAMKRIVDGAFLATEFDVQVIQRMITELTLDITARRAAPPAPRLPPPPGFPPPGPPADGPLPAGAPAPVGATR